VAVAEGDDLQTASFNDVVIECAGGGAALHPQPLVLLLLLLGGQALACLLPSMEDRMHSMALQVGVG
jgi:hypothetical protein